MITQNDIQSLLGTKLNSSVIKPGSLNKVNDVFAGGAEGELSAAEISVRYAGADEYARMIEDGTAEPSTVYVPADGVANKAYVDGHAFSKNGGVVSGDIVQVGGSFTGGNRSEAVDGSFAYGDGVSAIIKNSFTAGVNSVAGCAGYFIADKSDSEREYRLNTVDGICEGMVYSAYYNPGENLTNAFGNRDCIGKVTAVDAERKTITVDVMWAGTVNELTASYIWFPYENLKTGDARIGVGSAAIGYECAATQIGAFACGACTSAVGKYAHTEGITTIAVYAAHAEGKETSALGQGSHAEGRFTVAGTTDKNYCHAEGRYNEAVGYASHAAGQKCGVSSDTAWGWNGDTGVKYVVSGDARTGSFNVNPKNGLSGFWIGNKTLSEYINEAWHSEEITHIEDRISGVEDRVSGFEDRISGVEDRVSGFEDRIQNVSADVVEVSARTYMLDREQTRRRIYYATNAGYINRTTGQPTSHTDENYRYTDLIPLDGVTEITANYTARWSTAGWAVYNEDQTSAATGGYNKDNPSTKYTAKEEVISKVDLLEAMPDAKYIRFGTVSKTFDNTNCNSFLVETSGGVDVNEAVSDLESQVQRVSEAATTLGEQRLDFTLLDNTLLYLYTGGLGAYNGSVATDPIDMDGLPEKLKVSGTAQWSSCLYCLYDAGMNHVKSLGYTVENPNVKYEASNEIVDVLALRRTYPQARYIRFASLSAPKFKLSGCGAVAKNVLDGKTYVIAGDSFTYDTAAIRSYGNIVAERNGMSAVNVGMSGSYMCSKAQDDPKSFAQTILPGALPAVAKADYMTICYGLNELTIAAGTKDDASPDTIWGAWNVALSSIFETNPAIKLGIIIADSWMNGGMHDTLSAVARWWGVPCLDLKNGPTAMIDGRLDNSDLNPYVVEKRNSVFKVSSDNGHPTQKAQEFRSTIVENFLRSL